MTANHRYRLTKEALAPFAERNATAKEIADHFDVSTRSARRALVKHGFSEPSPQRIFTEVELAFARRLLDDNVPIAWVAETLKADRKAIVKHLGGRRDSVWSHVWPQIMRNPILLELHQEFAPK